MDSTAAERESGDRSRAEEREIGGHLGTEGEKVHRGEGAGDVKEKVPTEDAALEFCLVFTETAVQLMNRRPRQKIRSIIQLVANDKF